MFLAVPMADKPATPPPGFQQEETTRIMTKLTECRGYSAQM